MPVCNQCGRDVAPDDRFCAACGAALAAAEPAREERKVVTVLFADLVGFTARAEALDPEDVRALLSPYYACLRSELERFGGTVEKFIGDAVMAVFGQRQHVLAPKITQRIEPRLFGAPRSGRPETSGDRKGKFKRGAGYIGWKKSMYEQAWFDSSTELDTANILDDSDEISFWARLLVKRDLEIAWEGGNYYPDFIAVDSDNTHWVIEVKSDNEAGSINVKAKRQAALRWANHVSAAPKINGIKWRYLFVREADVAAAKGSWPALKGLGIA